MWAAENVPKSKSYYGSSSSVTSSPQQAQGSTRRSATSSSTRNHHRFSETPEAAMARLTSSYSDAMALTHALHALSKKIAKDYPTFESSGGYDADSEGALDAVVPPTAAEKDHTPLESLVEAAHKARDTFDSKILFDPLMKQYAKHTLSQIKYSSNGTASENHTHGEDHHFTSLAHVKALKQLMYATLVNYADLLLAGIRNDVHQKHFPSASILHRGIVSTLDALLVLQPHSNLTHTTTCWESYGETMEQTIRLAIIAYCDASDIDASDPILWLKLACATRRLSVLTDVSINEQKDKDHHDDGNDDHHESFGYCWYNWNYARLERYAIERGMMTLKKGLPPNRSIVKAFQEMETEMTFSVDRQYTSSNTMNTKQNFVELWIDLPKYSWTTLGRYLLLACKDPYSNDAPGITWNKSWNTTCAVKEDFGSPMVRIKISPLLVIPYRALVHICDYLGSYTPTTNTSTSSSRTTNRSRPSKDIIMLESTSKMISTAMSNARLLVEKDKNKRIRCIEQEMEQLMKHDSEHMDEGMSLQEIKQNTQHTAISTSSSLSQRTSARVRSNLITSSKQAERSAKRKNVEYCLVGALLPCTLDHPLYSSMVNEDFQWDTLACFSSLTDGGSSLTITSQSQTPSAKVKKDGWNVSPKRLHINNDFNRVSRPIELSDFLAKWTSENSGPFEVLHHFINHVAHHVEEIYSTELESASTVTQCIMECFDFLSTDCSSKTTSLLPCWFGKEKFDKIEDNLSEAIQVLATNLLFVELKMRSVEEKSTTCHSFSDDIHIVRTSLPVLLHLCENLDLLVLNDDVVRRRYVKLKTRTLFLAATFYIWWSRHTDQGNEIKELETLALDFIDKVIGMLESCLELQPFTIETKYLASLVRSGDIWSQLNITSIHRYKDEFQFCTVLSRVREHFSTLVNALKKDGKDYFEIPTDGTLRDNFETIKHDLFHRYSLDSEFSTSSFDELVEDFVSLHVSNLMGFRDGILAENDDDNLFHFHALLPSSSDTRVPLDKLSSPSVLTMILLCYHQTSDNYSMNLVKCLTRLVFISLDKRKRLLNGTDCVDLTSIIAEDSDSEEDMNLISSKSGDPRVYMRLVNLVLTVIIDIVKSEEVMINQSKLIMETINAVFDASICYSASESNIATQKVYPDIDCLQCVIRLVSVMINNGNNRMKMELSSFILALLTKTIVHGKQVVATLACSKLKKLSRSECHRLITSRAKVVAIAMTEVTALLTNNASVILKEGTYQESYLISTLTSISTNESICTPVVQLLASVAWLWEFSKSGLTAESQYANLTNTVHKTAAKMLMVPCSSIIISLCNFSKHGLEGTISKSFLSRNDERVGDQDISTHASDYFDSDDSVVKCIPGNVFEAEGPSKRRLLQSLKKAVQCIGLVYSECYESGMISAFGSILSPVENTSDVLSHVTIRALTNISDLVLYVFSQHQSSLGLWADSYPSGFQNSGMQLDLLLHKAYNRLYGVQLTAPHFYTSIQSDASVPPVNFVPLESESNIITDPSITTVVQLYRCLRRAYSNARRTIPSELLDFISSNLPPPDDESESVIAIQKFLFKGRDDIFLIENSEELLDNGSKSIGELPAEFPSWIFTNSPSSDSQAEDPDLSASREVKDIDTVRKGLWEYIADKATTTISHSVEMDDQNGQDLSDQMQERTIISCKIEKSADEKVFAIIHTLHYEPTDANKWFRMANAISLKLNHICDRLIAAEASYDASQFCVQQVESPEQRNERWKKARGHSKCLSSLLILQKMVYNQVEKKRHKLRDIDLSGFVDHQWSSAESVRHLEQILLHTAVGRDKRVLQKMQSLYDQGEYSKWQFEWGLHFINALRVIQRRCFDIALYLSKKHSAETGDENIISDVSEAYATSYYDSIGFNPEPITVYEKRQRAMRSRILFEAALASHLETSKACKTSEIMPTWEFRFMIGKCYEKIANTVDQEEYSEGDHITKRHYERLMMKALESYYEAYLEAKQFRDNGNVLDSQGGGSTNGLVEYSYRLHASRLKILIAAIKKPDSERNAALMEASRLLEQFWFDVNHDTIFDDAKLSDRIWIVFSDIISALASFRQVQPFFHRSVYRHAQALMWAPLIYDPNGSLGGSSDNVPPFKSHRIPELSRYPNACTAAESIISALFDKKRSQLCAVWVTTPSSPNPFERINDSLRKYDRLRCKYICAYLECLGLCEKYNEMETFLSWVKSSRRDLPSFYNVTCHGFSSKDYSASTELPLSVVTEAPPHWKDNLLDKGFGLIFFIKKYANIIMCRMLLNRFHHTRSKSNTVLTDGNSSSMTQESLDPQDMYYQLAFKCFLRLNCPLDSNMWQTQRIKSMMESHQIMEVECLISAHTFWVEVSSHHPTNSANHKDMSWNEILLHLYKSYQKASELYPNIQSEYDATLKKIRRKRKSMNE